MFLAIAVFSAAQAVGVYTGLSAVSDHRQLYGRLIEPVWMPNEEDYVPYFGYEAVQDDNS